MIFLCSTDNGERLSKILIIKFFFCGTENVDCLLKNLSSIRYLGQLFKRFVAGSERRSMVPEQLHLRLFSSAASWILLRYDGDYDGDNGDDSDDSDDDGDVPRDRCEKRG